MANEDEKFERWLNAYIDGELDAVQLAKFNDWLAKNPRAQQAVELQRSMDDSLRRVFQPPAQVTSAAGAQRERLRMSVDPDGVVADADGTVAAAAGSDAAVVSATNDHSTHSRSRIGWQWGALAAMLAVVAGGGAWWWAAFSGNDKPDPTYQYPTLLAFYDASAKNDFKEDWVCANSSEFAATFASRFGAGLKQPDTPPDLQLLGLKYGRTITGLTVHIMAKVNGAGVIVFVDKKSRDPSPPKKQGNLNVYRLETEHLIAYEMTPHDNASILPLLEEREVSPEEIAQFYGR